MLNFEQMVQDVAQAATIGGVEFDEAILREVMSVYRKPFTETAVEFRLTTKPLDKRDLSVRYVDFFYNENPYPLALETGLLPDARRPVDALLPAIYERFDVIGTGLDIGVTYGLEKLWAFPGVVPLSRALEFDALPPSVAAYEDFFVRYNMRHFSLFAIDYRNATTNLYFMTESPTDRDPEVLAAMLRDLGFTIPSEEVLAYCAMTPSIALTFSWDSPVIERACFYVPHPEPSRVPRWMDPFVGRFVDQMPMQTDQRAYVISWTAGRRGDYVKLENDYSGTVMAAFQRSLTATPA